MFGAWLNARDEMILHCVRRTKERKTGKKEGRKEGRKEENAGGARTPGQLLELKLELEHRLVLVRAHPPKILARGYWLGWEAREEHARSMDARAPAASGVGSTVCRVETGSAWRRWYGTVQGRPAAGRSLLPFCRT
jgi:hypothetical protein